MVTGGKHHFQQFLVMGGKHYFQQFFSYFLTVTRFFKKKKKKKKVAHLRTLFFFKSVNGSTGISYLVLYLEMF